MATDTLLVQFVEDRRLGFALERMSVERSMPSTKGPSSFADYAFLLLMTDVATWPARFVAYLRFPGDDAPVLARQLRHSLSNTISRNVIVSSRAKPRDTQAAKRYGADDYHVQPVVPAEFLRVGGRNISRWLHC